jgi:hypothetical protein
MQQAAAMKSATKQSQSRRSGSFVAVFIIEAGCI